MQKLHQAAAKVLDKKVSGKKLLQIRGELSFPHHPPNPLSYHLWRNITVLVHSADSSRLFGMGWKAQSPTQVLLLCPPELSVWVSLLSPTSPIFQTPFSWIQLIQGTSHYSKSKVFLLRLKVQVWITNLLNPAPKLDSLSGFLRPRSQTTHPPPSTQPQIYHQLTWQIAHQAEILRLLEFTLLQ